MPTETLPTNQNNTPADQDVEKTQADKHIQDDISEVIQPPSDKYIENAPDWREVELPCQLARTEADINQIVDNWVNALALFYKTTVPEDVREAIRDKFLLHIDGMPEKLPNGEKFINYMEQTFMVMDPEGEKLLAAVAAERNIAVSKNPEKKSIFEAEIAAMSRGFVEDNGKIKKTDHLGINLFRPFADVGAWLIESIQNWNKLAVAGNEVNDHEFFINSLCLPGSAKILQDTEKAEEIKEIVINKMMKILKQKGLSDIDNIEVDFYVSSDTVQRKQMHQLNETYNFDIKPENPIATKIQNINFARDRAKHQIGLPPGIPVYMHVWFGKKAEATGNNNEAA